MRSALSRSDSGNAGLEEHYWLMCCWSEGPSQKSSMVKCQPWGHIEQWSSRGQFCTWCCLMFPRAPPLTCSRMCLLSWFIVRQRKCFVIDIIWWSNVKPGWHRGKEQEIYFRKQLPWVYHGYSAMERPCCEITTRAPLLFLWLTDCPSVSLSRVPALWNGPIETFFPELSPPWRDWNGLGLRKTLK